MIFIGKKRTHLFPANNLYTIRLKNYVTNFLCLTEGVGRERRGRREEEKQKKQKEREKGQKRQEGQKRRQEGEERERRRR